MKKRFLIGILLLTLCVINPYKVEAKITDCIYTVDYCITRTTGGSGAASGASIKQESTYTLTIHNNNGSPKASVTCKSGSCKDGATVSVSNIFGTGNANDFKNDNGEFKCPTLYKCSKCVSKVGDSQGKYYSNQTTAISGHSCSNAVSVSPSERKDDGTGNTSGTTGSTTGKTTVLKGCENPTVLKIIYFVLNMLKIATYLVPVGLIFMGMYDFIKAMITNDNTVLKNTIPNFVRRIIGAIVIFLVPTIINFGFGLVENDIHSGYLMCIKNANAETIKELKNKEVQLNKEEQERIKKEQEEIKKKNEETKNNEQSQMQAGNGSNLGSKLNSIITSSSKKVAFLASLKKMSEQVEKDAKNGRKWVYSNKDTRDTFGYANKTVKTTNCALMAVWGLIEIDILSSGDRFYKAYQGGTNKMVYKKRTKSKMAKTVEYIDGGNKTATSLIKSGKLQPGDIIAWYNMQHTNVYAGDNKWYDAGRRKDINGKFYGSVFKFDTLGPVKVSKTNKWRVWKIIRIKG